MHAFRDLGEEALAHATRLSGRDVASFADRDPDRLPLCPDTEIALYRERLLATAHDHEETFQLGIPCQVPARRGCWQPCDFLVGQMKAYIGYRKLKRFFKRFWLPRELVGVCSPWYPGVRKAQANPPLTLGPECNRRQSATMA